MLKSTSSSLKHLPSRDALLSSLGLSSSYYAAPLATGWRLLVLDTTELSPQLSINGGIGEAQMGWLREQLQDAEAKAIRLIVASHHPLAPGSCTNETLRSWTGDAVATLLCVSPAVALVLSGHDHAGGFALWKGKAFVTIEACASEEGAAPVGAGEAKARRRRRLLEEVGAVSATEGDDAGVEKSENAYGLVRCWPDRIAIDGCGTRVTSREIVLTAAAAAAGGGASSSTAPVARPLVLDFVAAPPPPSSMPPPSPPQHGEL